MKTSTLLVACSVCVACSFANAQSTGVSATQSASVPAMSVAPAPAPVRQQKQQARTGRRHLTQPPPEQTPQQPPQQQRGGRRQPQQDTSQQPESTAGPENATQPRRTNRPHRSSSEPSAMSYGQALQRQHRERHDHAWWKTRYTTIVFVRGCGHYYLDAGYWFPAWGYDPGNENFEYNGPIYTYGNLLPDQVIYNVQRALKELGYYTGALNGSLGPSTRAAISAFQEDNDLEITGVVDEPTVEALGLY